ncbi:ArdC family protein [Brevifollis gellanilyticus]|nr:zincin-like metallopeptidase domain-containing protein [Brevifollis gellanilyticus]
MSTAESRIDPYQAVTNLIIEHLERGVVPWRCPWQREVGIPRNFHTGKTYNGVNVLLLGLRHMASPYWLTFRQAQERGGHVRRGEHGARIIKVGNPKSPDDENSDQPTQQRRKSNYLRGYTVFNATQIEGIEFPPLPNIPQLCPHERIQAAEQIVSEMQLPPTIKEGMTTAACYRMTTDTVHIPALAAFESAETFYNTLFHELIHASGHADRLNRESLIKHDGFGGKVYSQEELVAEMGAAFLCMECHIVNDSHEKSAAYLQSWLDVLRVTDHKRWIIQAASHAGKATAFILNRATRSDEDDHAKTDT